MLYMASAFDGIFAHIKKDEMDGACSVHGEIRNAYKSLVGKPEGKRPLGRPRRRWEDNIRRILEKQGWKMFIGFIWLWISTGGELL
jgi:hypothetical protein